ncbi:hypothetical protein BKA64DRAFT_683354 [Cadophora sp. MPI-SDFR-AT-0126]|nr:hypothetical protein BKA64DRAFT_683354 [Leotiomycetes sp. MPI-SDFR-AT-0126]
MAPALSSFTLFGRLPAEIRCEIWKFAAPGPRIIPIKFDMNRVQYQSRISTPAILRVSQESRHEALKIYHELLLGPCRNIGCYIDIDRDTVYIKGGLVRNTNRIRTVHITPAPCLTENGSSEPLLLPAIEPNNTSSSAYILPSGREGITRTFYTELILDDLMTSPDGKIMLRDLHIEFETWQLLRAIFWRRRHKHPRRVEKLTIISERGNGPFRDIGLQDIRHEPASEGVELSATDMRNYILSRMKTSFIATSRYWNRRDKAAGLPQVLTCRIEMKALVKGENGF